MTVRSLTDLLSRLSNTRHGNEAQDLRDLAESVVVPQFSGASASKSVSQTVATTATVTWNGTHWDTDGYFDNANDQFVIPAGLGGYFFISSAIALLSASGDTFPQLIITSAESNPGSIRFNRNTAASTSVFGGGVVLKLAAADAVSVTISGDASFDVRESTNGTWFQIVRLGQVPV